MKILQVIHQFLPKHQAGSEIYTYSLSKALAARGHDVRVFAFEHGGALGPARMERSDYNSLPVYRVWHVPVEWGKLLWLGQALNSFKDEWIGSRFREVLREFRPDVVHLQHLHNVSGTVVRHAKQCRVPVLMTLHDFWLMCPRINLYDYKKKICSNAYGGWRCGRCMELTSQVGLQPWLSSLTAPLFAYRRFYLRTVMREIDLFISPSHFLRRQMIEFGIPEGKIIASDNGYDVSRFVGYEKVPSVQFRVGYIGSIMEHKGIHLLIEAFRKLSGDAVLKIFGDPAVQPTYGEKLKKMSEGDSRIHFCGRFENAAIGKILSEIDVLVVPSLWYENSPLTIHEAFLAGVPIVAAGIGGMAEFVRDGINGLHFKYGDIDDLHRKLALLYEDRSALDALSQPTPVKTIQENAEEIERLYQTTRRAG